MDQRMFKSIITTTLCASLLLLLAPAQTIKEHQSQLNDLSPTQKKQFFDSLKESEKLLQEKRIFDAIHSLEDARKLLPNNPYVTRLRANTYIEIRMFDTSRALYQELLDYNPKKPSLLFNLGEMDFVEHKWKESLEYFTQARSYNAGRNLGFTDLLAFKIYICNKKLGNKDMINEAESAYDYTSDTPLYYYINFVKYKETGDKEEAMKWAQRATNIFGPKALAPWNDTITEAGFLDEVAEKH